MSTCTLTCPHCSTVQTVSQESLGQTIRCASCSNLIQVPPPQMNVVDSTTVYCYKCGQRNDVTSTTCLQCGAELRHDVRPDSIEDTIISRVIPYKNTLALTAYYCAVFALIPCVGIILGHVALVLGVLGLKHVKAHPEAHGKVHAWIGVILGGLCGMGYTLLIVMALVG
jgi:predicted Zn finger-like uncharacterized protein